MLEANEYTKLISGIIIYLPSLPIKRLIKLFGIIKSEAIQRMTDGEEIDERVKIENQVFFENDLSAPAFIQAILKQESES
ncbi:MAG TPA: hypothetical protein DCQ51_12415 [Planktothrix sp. UBA8407]|jgi:hypothetical protein|nr:hypothetical protein [Planktothrix sp. UBA8407]